MIQFEYVQPDHVALAGPLTYETVTELYKRGKDLLAGQNSLYFDLREVTQVNSAALALLINWLRYARKKGKSIYFQHIPKQLLDIAQLSDVLSMLPVVKENEA